MNRLLLIEDEEDIRDILPRLLASCQRCFDNKVSIDLAKTLAEGVAKISVNPYDCILLDLGLPDSRTHETVNRITEFARFWPPIIIVTGTTYDEVRRDCLRHGAFGFMLKSVAVACPEALLETCYNATIKHHAYRPAA